MKTKKLGICLSLIGLMLGLADRCPGKDDSELVWRELSQQLEQSEEALSELIEKGRREGVCTSYAEVSAATVSIFRKAAWHDREHLERVREIFGTFSHFDDTDPLEAENLAFNEMRACLELSRNAQAELSRQLAGEIELVDPPDLSKGEVAMGPGYYEIDERPFFPSSIVWMPAEDPYLDSFGRIGQGAYSMNRPSEKGGHQRGRNKRHIESAIRSVDGNLAPYVFFVGHNAPGWMREEYPELLHGGRNFTQYDIDSPLIRKWFSETVATTLPAWSEALGEAHPRLHLLANEPHFATRLGGWKASNGLSDHTIAKYHSWLRARYGKIESLNETYGSDFPRFSDVDIFLAEAESRYGDDIYRRRQVNSNKYRGTPVWYDWCRFNMDRVNEWFSFLKEQVQANDGVGAPVTIKTLGFTLSRDTRDGGMDLEYLTNLQEIPGADLRVAPQGARFYGKHEEGMDPETGWMAYYAYDWIEQSMFLDFTKSLCPEKVFYDSEWHGFGAVSWRDFSLSREYIRSALWMAFSDGMGMIKPWVWGRKSDGSLSRGTDHIGELSTQPIAVDAFGRTMKELNAHADWLAPGVQQQRSVMIYYCEEAAIQDGEYTTGLQDIYEALRLLNIRVGFATPTTIAGLDPESQTVILPPTVFGLEKSLSALRKFQGSGGKVLGVDPSRSFVKTEHGRERAGAGLGGLHAELAAGDARALLEPLRNALGPLLPKDPVELSVADELGGSAYGVMIRQIKHPVSGKQIIVLNNISKSPRKVSWASGKFFDGITSRQVSSPITMAPCDVRVLIAE